MEILDRFQPPTRQTQKNRLGCHNTDASGEMRPEKYIYIYIVIDVSNFQKIEIISVESQFMGLHGMVTHAGAGKNSS